MVVLAFAVVVVVVVVLFVDAIIFVKLVGVVLILSFLPFQLQSGCFCCFSC